MADIVSSPRVLSLDLGFFKRPSVFLGFFEFPEKIHFSECVFAEKQVVVTETVRNQLLFSEFLVNKKKKM